MHDGHNEREHGHAHHHHKPEAAANPSDTPPVKAILGYMLDHNQHHAEEIGTMAAAVQESNADAARLLEAAAELMKQANACILGALERME